MQQGRLKIALLSGLCAVSTAVLAGGPPGHHHSNRLPSVDSIRVSGRIHLMLKASDKRVGRVVMTNADPSAQYSVDGHVLTITSGSAAGLSRPTQVTVSLSSPLHRLVLSGGVHVEGRRVPTSALEVAMSGASVLDLSGIVGLSKLKQSGASSARLDWVNSSHLIINASGLSTSYLAGVANHLEAKLTGHSTLYAQYLQANTVFVATQGNAMVYVMPIANMRAFSRGRSNIYYVTQPVHKTLQFKGNGNILFMNSDDPWNNMDGIYRKAPHKK